MNDKDKIFKLYSESYTYSEEDFALVSDICNDYYVKFSQLIAEELKKVKPELQDELLGRLQDLSSVYGSKYDEYLEADTPQQQHL